MYKAMSGHERFACPCCGDRTLDDVGHFDICGSCGWEDDPIQREQPDYDGGANRESLNQARERFLDSHAGAAD